MAGNGLICFGYVDDSVIMARGKLKKKFCDFIRCDLEAIQPWCSRVNPRINPAKTTLVSFIRKRNLPRSENSQNRWCGNEMEVGSGIPGNYPG